VQPTVTAADITGSSEADGDDDDDGGPALTVTKWKLPSLELGTEENPTKSFRFKLIVCPSKLITDFAGKSNSATTAPVVLLLLCFFLISVVEIAMVISVSRF